MRKDPILDSLHKVRLEIVRESEKAGITLTRYFENFERSLKKPLLRPGDLTKRGKKAAA